MGYRVDDYLIVSHWSDGELQQAMGIANALFDAEIVSNLIPHKVNGSSSFFISTSGSKNGWSHKSEHVESIDEFFRLVKTARLWVHVVYITVTEEGQAKIARSYPKEEDDG